MPAYLYPDSTSDQFLTKTGVQTSTGPKTFTGAGAGDIPLTVQGIVSQSGHLAQFKNDSGGVLAYFNRNGDLYTPALGVNAVPYSGLGDVTCGIAANFSNTKGLVVRGAVGQMANLAEFQDSSGTAFAAFEPNGVIRLKATNSYLNWNGDRNQYFVATAANSIPLTIAGAVSQTANLQEWQDSAGAVLAAINPGGRIIGSGGINATAPTTASTALSVQGMLGQTTDLIRLLDSTGKILTTFAYTGEINHYNGYARIRIASIGDYGVLRTFNDAPAAAGVLVGRMLHYGEDSAGNDTLYTDIRHLTEVVTDGSESGYTDFYTMTSGALKATMRVGQNAFAAHVWINQTTQRGLVIRGIASQTANSFEVQNSAGAVVAGVTSSGILMTSGANTVSTATAGTAGALPSAPRGYFYLQIDGTNMRVPYYNA